MIEDGGACIESGKRPKWLNAAITWSTYPQYTVARLLCTQAILLDQQNGVYAGPVGRSRYRIRWERIGCPDGSSALCQQEKSNLALLKLRGVPCTTITNSRLHRHQFSSPLRNAHCFLVSVTGCPIRLVDGQVCRLLSKLIVDLVGRIAQSIVQDCRPS